MSKKPFIPHILPPANLNWERLASFISKSTLELARYDGTLNGVLNPGVLLSPITSKEAVLSSRIEGTQATLIEVLQHEAGQNYDENKQGDIQEIINYRRALLEAEKELDERPITLHLIRSLHAILMSNVRGGDKTPGDFRQDQNWIGKKGSTMEQARFVPPDPIVMNEHLNKLQIFIDADYIDPLVQLAIIHAQFEIIHPFNDGNGRLGRMLIPLFLYQKRVLQRPVFYLSEYLEEADQEYRDRLLFITDNNGWQEWVEFFLKAVQIQAKKNNEKAIAIHNLYEKMKPIFCGATKSKYSQTALDAFFRKPIINSSDFMRLCGTSNRGMANELLSKLIREKLVVRLKSQTGQTPAIYAFPQLINTAEGRDVIKDQSKTDA